MRPKLTIIGADPGGRESGVVVRRGDELLDHCILIRHGPADLPDADYLEAVCVAIVGYRDTRQPLPLVAIEGVKAPVGFKFGRRDPINLKGILGAAMVLGAVLAIVPDAIVVAPSQHGSAPMSTYPAALIGAREKSGAGHLRHCRSGWDVAGSALGSMRIGSAAS